MTTLFSSNLSPLSWSNLVIATSGKDLYPAGIIVSLTPTPGRVVANLDIFILSTVADPTFIMPNLKPIIAGRVFLPDPFMLNSVRSLALSSITALNGAPIGAS